MRHEEDDGDEDAHADVERQQVFQPVGYHQVHQKSMSMFPQMEQ